MPEPIGGEASGVSGLARRGLTGATRPQSAQSIVEFLLVSIPLFMTIFGLLEFGLAFYESTTTDYAARIGAHETAVCGQQCDAVSASDSSKLIRDYNLLH